MVKMNVLKLQLKFIFKDFNILDYITFLQNSIISCYKIQQQIQTSELSPKIGLQILQIIFLKSKYSYIQKIRVLYKFFIISGNLKFVWICIQKLILLYPAVFHGSAQQIAYISLNNLQVQLITRKFYSDFAEQIVQQIWIYFNIKLNIRIYNCKNIYQSISKKFINLQNFHCMILYFERKDYLVYFQNYQII
eukprot:TRINITY_DN1932_c0_g1_i1.p1 TRINITY_DN1932_c0_g1~~TRINITY_DN1932_c0_g1_i1.p1  ORF type:complete len:192 (+),score=-15.77 TRINITY_DN1932_c0_g1_i1:968-1543(+)